MAHLTTLDFDNVVVLAATNPSLGWGYHHGPIPNHNPQWYPARQQAAWDNYQPLPAVTVADNNEAPNQPARLSALNGAVCDIDINAGQMCGVVCSSQPALRRHIRNSHPGAVANTTTTNMTDAERISGENALKNFVLTRGWRNARYLNEPGRGPVGGLLDTYATACERLARQSPAFAQQFGDRFHRDPVGPPGSSAGKRKRGPSPPPPPPSADYDAPDAPSPSRDKVARKQRKNQRHAVV